MAKPTVDDTRIYLPPSEVIDLLREIIIHNAGLSKDASDAAYIAPMIWGNPGIGKTRCVFEAARQASEKLGIDLPVIVEPIADKSPEEISGYPSPSSDGLSFKRLMPNKWLQARENRVVAFFDEVAQGNVEQMNVARGAILGQTVGDVKFRHGCTVVGASNPMEDRAGTHVMPTHFRDAVTHIWMRPDHKEWSFWGVGKGISPEITSFIYVHGARHLNDLSTSPTAMANPSPRSWEKVDEIMKMEVSDSVMRAMVAGQVGPSASGDFFTHLKIGNKMPNIDKILSGKGGKLNESESDVVYMTMCSLASRVEESTVQAMVDWLKLLKHREFASFCINMALRRDPKLYKTKGAMEWMIEYEPDLIL